MTKIAIVNRSSVMEDSAVAKITHALQRQVMQDFAPIWGYTAELLFVGKGDGLPAGTSLLGVFDTSDQADALGYHDITPEGLPLGKAFAKSDLDYGYEPSVTISHELLEMLADPQINRCMQVGSRMFACEVCDACEADRFGYPVEGVLVSDFVVPEWFAPAPEVRGPFDFQKHIDKPLGLLPGGYLQYLDLGANAGWQQVTADKARARERARVGSRRERRRVGRDSWQTSEPVPR